MHTWISTPVKVTPHRSLNTFKGVIRCREMRDCSDEEVLEALSHEGVTHIKHIFTKKNGSSIATSTFILTFNKPTAPKSIRAVYQHIPVEPFIPNPMRCFNCQRFGHGKSPCNHTAVCARCSKEGHCDADCNEEPHCTNCSGSHPAFSKECPEWIKQRAIVQIKTERNISFSEAKQIYTQQAPQSHNSIPTRQRGVSYAAVGNYCCSVSTQTDLTWPSDSKIPIIADNPSTCHRSAKLKQTVILETAPVLECNLQ
jgi:hypothetical protein